MKSYGDTVDGRNPAPVDRYFIQLFKRFHTSQMVSWISSINRMTYGHGCSSEQETNTAKPIFLVSCLALILVFLHLFSYRWKLHSTKLKNYLPQGKKETHFCEAPGSRGMMKVSRKIAICKKIIMWSVRSKIDLSLLQQ